MTSGDVDPAFKFHASRDINDEENDAKDGEKDTKTTPGGACCLLSSTDKTPILPEVVATPAVKPLLANTKGIYNPTPPASPKTGPSKVRSRTARNVLHTTGTASAKPATQGEASDVTTQGETSDVTTQGERCDVGAQGKTSDVSATGETSDVSAQDETSDVTTQGETSVVTEHGEISDVTAPGGTRDVTTHGDTSDVTTQGDTSDVTGPSTTLHPSTTVLPCIKPKNINIIPSTSIQNTSGAGAALDDPVIGDVEDTHGGLPGKTCRDEYSDDFEDSEDEDLDFEGDFEMDEQLYAELAFGVDIEPGDLDPEPSDLDPDLVGVPPSGHVAAVNDFSLEIVGQKMSVAEAWPEGGAAVPPGGVAPPSGGAPNKGILIESKLGPNVFLMKDLAEERKHQFKVLRRVPVRDADPEVIVSGIQTLQSQLSHDHLVGVASVGLEEGSISITQQYCEGGTLHGLISRARALDEILNEIEILDWFVQSLLALRHLHSQNITHQEITTSNIYLKNNCVKLGAPECFKRLYRKARKVPNRKIHYMSPEALTGGEITNKSDMWSLGCVLYELCALKRLFRGKRREQITARVCSSGVSDALPPFPDYYAADIADIWRRLLAPAQNERPSADDVLQLPYLAEHLQDMTESMKHWKSDDSFGDPVQHTPPGGWSDPDVDEDCYLTEEDARQLLGY